MFQMGMAVSNVTTHTLLSKMVIISTISHHFFLLISAERSIIGTQKDCMNTKCADLPYQMRKLLRAYWPPSRCFRLWNVSQIIKIFFLLSVVCFLVCVFGYILMAVLNYCQPWMVSVRSWKDLYSKITKNKFDSNCPRVKRNFQGMESFCVQNWVIFRWNLKVAIPGRRKNHQFILICGTFDGK